MSPASFRIAAPRSLLAAVVACGLFASPATGVPAGGAAAPSASVAVSGSVKKPLALSVDDLKAFPADQVATVAVHGRPGASEPSSSVRGVKLTAVLDRAGLAEAGHDDWKRTVVVASGTDGYRVVFSWPELYETTVGDEVVVVLERDGRPLGDGDGHIALASPADRRPARNVKWLNRIEVRVLQD
jgi:DMSO/TMAO reductase YedYZ molybdopterin-dependent catalytic subunit